jgi:hypothetical protein
MDIGILGETGTRVLMLKAKSMYFFGAHWKIMKL